MTYCTFNNVIEEGIARGLKAHMVDYVWHAPLLKLAGGGECSFLPDTHWLSGVAYHYAALANQQEWGFDLNGSSAIQACRYMPESDHDWHIDSLGLHIAGGLTRKLTVVIDCQVDRHVAKGGHIELLLSEQDSGKKIIRLDNDAPLSVHVFPSYIPFRTTAVTQGERYYWLCWGLGSRFI